MMTSSMTSSSYTSTELYRGIQRNHNQVWLVPRTVEHENVIYFPGFRQLEDRRTSQRRVTQRANNSPLDIDLAWAGKRFEYFLSGSCLWGFCGESAFCLQSTSESYQKDLNFRVLRYHRCPKLSRGHWNSTVLYIDDRQPAKELIFLF